jgi:hypothetical protein
MSLRPSGSFATRNDMQGAEDTVSSFNPFSQAALNFSTPASHPINGPRAFLYQWLTTLEAHWF